MLCSYIFQGNDKSVELFRINNEKERVSVASLRWERLQREAVCVDKIIQYVL